MFAVCKETTLVMLGLMPAASILLFMLVQKTYLHLGSALMHGYDGLAVFLLFCYLIIFITTTPIDIKPSTCPAHGRHASRACLDQHLIAIRSLGGRSRAIKNMNDRDHITPIGQASRPLYKLGLQPMPCYAAVPVLVNC